MLRGVPGSGPLLGPAVREEQLPAETQPGGGPGGRSLGALLISGPRGRRHLRDLFWSGLGIPPLAQLHWRSLVLFCKELPPLLLCSGRNWSAGLLSLPLLLVL